MERSGFATRNLIRSRHLHRRIRQKRSTGCTRVRSGYGRSEGSAGAEGATSTPTSIVALSARCVMIGILRQSATTPSINTKPHITVLLLPRSGISHCVKPRQRASRRGVGASAARRVGRWCFLMDLGGAGPATRARQPDPQPTDSRTTHARPTRGPVYSRGSAWQEAATKVGATMPRQNAQLLSLIGSFLPALCGSNGAGRTSMAAPSPRSPSTDKMPENG